MALPADTFSRIISDRFWPIADPGRLFQVFSTKLTAIDPKRTKRIGSNIKSFSQIIFGDKEVISILTSTRNYHRSWLLLFILFFHLTPIAYAELPEVVKINGKKTLKLPNNFIHSLPELAPGYRLPNSSDLKTLWESESDKISGLPYVCWGDYNGDGTTDIGIFLAKKGKWKFFVFHLIKGKYKQRLGNDIDEYGPQFILVKTLKRGKTFTYKGEKSHNYKYQNDAILYQYDGGRVDIYTWQNDQLIEEVFGSD